MRAADIKELLLGLAINRPVFHSEADFQYALAMEMSHRHPDSSVRLEYRPLPEESVYVDIWTASTAIELKYMTKRLDVVVNGERFLLRNQGAHDVVAYDVWKDVVRLERVVQETSAANGILVVLANDPLYWRPPSRPGAGYDAFRLHHGRVASGELGWGDRAGPGTRRGREVVHLLSGTYDVQWFPYSRVASDGPGEFRGFLLEIEGRKDSPH
jgi:hypothetical protein